MESDILKTIRCLCVYTAVDHVVAVWWLQLHFVKGSQDRWEKEEGSDKKGEQ